MFYLYQSNRLERLFAALCEITARPLSGPLVPEEIVVQNPGTARWLSRQIASRKGVAANLHFPLPARFVWKIFASQLQIPDDVRDFDRQALLWRIYGLLGQLAKRSDFEELDRYLHGDRDGRKQFQLAGRIADLFDQYLVYRPDLLLGWEKGEGTDWQAVLWRKLTEAGAHHRAGLLKNFMEMHRAGLLVREILPERIIVFGVSSLAPAYLEVVHAVSTVCDVHFFHLSPCRSFWFDLVSEKEMARKRSLWRQKKLPDVSEYYMGGNSLLASLGAVGREFSLQIGDLDGREIELYESPTDTSLLACVQKDILDFPSAERQENIPECGVGNDGSIQFHICHSRLREIQVLHDRLLDMFAQDPHLKPGDILVMAPDIEAYNSSVRAVFESVAQEKYIPWSLADRSFRHEQPIAETFLSIFELLSGRFSAPEVVAFLENDPVLRRFGIEKTAVNTIRTWVRESGIRWGMDSGHRQEYGYTMSDLHSWSFGMKRMLFGFIAGAGGAMFADIAPYASLSTEDSVLLGKLAAFVDRLGIWKKRVQSDKTVDEWGKFLYGILDDLFAPGSSESDFNALLMLREKIGEWLDYCHAAGIAGTVGPEVIKDHFTGILSGKVEGQAFLSGRVTFCNMVPMRSVPFSVIWLLGMNDTEYPRNQQPAVFDYISKNPRTGDRNRRNDDCYLFLEALISARRIFSMSWIGRDQQDNSIRPPSVVVLTLLDYLRRQGYIQVGEQFSPPAIEHPLQPFSSRCFDGSVSTASYAAEWLPAGAASKPLPFLTDILPFPDEEWRYLDVAQLVRFWVHPVQFFLRERLGLDYTDRENILPEKEPFQADALDRYHLAHLITDDLLKGRNVQERYVLLRSAGRLPHGSFGRKIFAETCAAAEKFVTSLTPLAGCGREDLEVDLQIGQFRLSGWLNGLHEKGLVRFRSTRLKSKDTLRLWVEHLVYNLTAPEGFVRTSYHVASDIIVRLHPVEDPLPELDRLLNLFGQGLMQPLRFYPKTSEACYLAREKGKPFDPGPTWESGFKTTGEGDDAAYRTAFRDEDPFAQPFAEYAVAIYEPLYHHRETSSASI